MIAYASYLPRKSEIVRDSLTISLANSLFSIVAGFGVFAILGYMAHATQQPIGQVVSQSIGLAFVAFPKAISLLPAFSRIFGMLFFASLVIAGLSSSISIIEAFTSGIVDKFHYPRKIIVSILCVAGFLGSIVFATQAGLFWLDIVDHFLTRYGLVIAAIFECIIIGWIYRAKRLREHITNTCAWRLPRVWDASVKIVIPIVLVILLINSLIKEFTSAYEGYPVLSLVLIGRDWLIFTLFLALIVSGRTWKIEPAQRVQH
jgi:NSS family neurotransmitter:Na+ symporter